MMDFIDSGADHLAPGIAGGARNNHAAAIKCDGEWCCLINTHLLENGFIDYKRKAVSVFRQCLGHIQLLLWRQYNVLPAILEIQSKWGRTIFLRDPQYHYGAVVEGINGWMIARETVDTLYNLRGDFFCAGRSAGF